MFRRIYKTITNIFRRQKKDKVKDNQDLAIPPEQEEEKIADSQIYAAVPAIENGFNVLKQEPLNNAKEEPKESSDSNSIEATTVKSQGTDDEKLGHNEAEIMNHRDNDEEKHNESENRDSFVKAIQAYDGKLTKDSPKTCMKTIYTVTIVLQRKYSGGEDSPVKSQEPDNEELVNETERETENIIKLENGKEINKEAVSEKEEIKTSRENRESCESESNSLKICEVEKKKSDARIEIADHVLQCPVDSANVQPLVPDQAKEETRVQRSPRTSAEDYELKSLLGQGAFGTVFLAKHKHSEELVAIKTLQKRCLHITSDVERVKLEKSILELVRREQNPFLVGLFASFQTASHLCLAMDFCPGGDLDGYLRKRKFPLERVRFYAGCIVLGLQFLHKNNIIHKDLKPENVLLASDGYAKITDYGLAKKTLVYGGIAWTCCGTRFYMAPELVNCDRHTKAVDWWALGVMIYEMILCEIPFYDDNSRKMNELIRTKEPKYPKTLSTESVNIIQKLLIKDPTQRLGSSDRDAEEVMECSFFTELDFNALSKKEITAPFIPKKKNKQGCSCRIFRRQKRVVLSTSKYREHRRPLKFVEEEFKDFNCSTF